MSEKIVQLNEESNITGCSVFNNNGAPNPSKSLWENNFINRCAIFDPRNSDFVS